MVCSRSVCGVRSCRSAALLLRNTTIESGRLTHDGDFRQRPAATACSSMCGAQLFNETACGTGSRHGLVH